MNSAVHRRMNVLLLLDDGLMPEQIAKVLYLDESTVRDHQSLYRKQGRVGVESLGYVGGQRALTAKDIAAWIAARFKVSYTPHGALCWPERTVIHREEERITSAAMIALFEDILAKHPRAMAIPIILDNARYNRSRELRAWSICHPMRPI